MLEKMERLYLGALRVAILIVATIALLAAVIGLVSIVPDAMRWSGLGENDVPTGGTLGQYIEEQKITETSASADREPDNTRTTTYPDIGLATDNIQKYLGIRGSVPRDVWASSLQKQALDMGDQGLAYAADVRRLTGQLLKSQGKPLSEERVAKMLSWHSDRFKQSLASLRAADAEASAALWFKLGSAGAAFLAFISIIFIFLFVKIERNLRVLQSISIHQDGRIDGHA